MSLFNRNKKVTSKCDCGEICSIGDIEKARFIVLGACCQKSKDTFENVKVAVREMGFDDEVLNIGDNLQIAKYGVMSTPALVIESKVFSSGKMLKVEDAKRLIEKAGIKA